MKEKLQFSGALQKLIDQRGINASALGKAIGLSHVAIGNYLRGESLPGALELCKIADYFQVPLETVLGRRKALIDYLKTPAPAPPQFLINQAADELSQVEQRLQNLKRTISLLSASSAAGAKSEASGE